MGARIEYEGAGIYRFIPAEQVQEEENERRAAFIAEVERRYAELYGNEKHAK